MTVPPDDDTDRPTRSDDMPPPGDEARAEREETSMPLLWLIAGLAVIAIFMLFLVMRGSPSPGGAPGPSPHKQAAARLGASQS